MVQLRVNWLLRDVKAFRNRDVMNGAKKAEYFLSSVFLLHALFSSTSPLFQV